MRFLNKIIFLNSAHIPYAEVKLDGNVHFIGTQGVGKSTLLRAILFFYNADKLRLGIPKEKRSFDIFYFAFSNSYIVYEVMRENGAYCVLVAKSQGRVFFRLIDAPYHREWFLDNRNEVLDDFGRIRSKVEQVSGKVFVSNQITGYEEFRDIIFGNNRRQEMGAYRRFAIVESPNYQNIPRTIQNVFLNSKLEADFIKDTIIRSTSEEDISIDMDYFRNQIKDFEQEYNDVSLWFNKNRNGEVAVRKQAEKSINAYRDLMYTRGRIETARAELNYAEKRACQLLPLVKEEIDRHTTESERLKRLVSEEGRKYNMERDGLNREMGEVESFLKKVREKRAYYERIGIEGIMHRVEAEDDLKLKKSKFEEMISELTKAYEDVISRYRSLEEKLEIGFQAEKNERERQILNRKTEHHTEVDRYAQQWRDAENRIRTAQEERMDEAGRRIQQLRDDMGEIRLQKQKLGSFHPYEKEIGNCEKELSSLNEKEKDTAWDIERLQAEMDKLRGECDLELKGMEMDFKAERESMIRQRTESEEHIRKLESQLDRRKGSFCEWLQQHKPDWVHTFGKVADEEHILYNSELDPTIEGEDSQTVFGVRLNLEAVNRVVHTPEEMRHELEEYEKIRNGQTQQLNKLSEKHEADVDDVKGKYSKKIRERQDCLQQLKMELLQIPVQKKEVQADLASWKTKEEEWRRASLEEQEHKLEEVAASLRQAEDELNKIKTEQERQLKYSQKQYKDAVTKLQGELKVFEETKRGEIDELRQQMQAQKTELRKQQDDELSGKGADTSILKSYNSELETVNKELDYIANNRKTVWAYERDKTEYFDKEAEKRNDKKEVEIKLTVLRERFDNRMEKLMQQLSVVNENLQQKRNEQKALEDGLNKVAAFKNDPTLCPIESEEAGEKSTLKTCGQLVDELKSMIVSLMQKTQDFKKAVNQFNGNFSSRNTFHFRTELTSDDDYFDFAVNLCEFVDNDKISDYQKRISERYTDIIGRVSKEVGALTSRESEIAKTINDINRDFVERNFAGVIKEIALRSTPSNDKLMRLLLEIKKFYDENQYDMGELDLFSQASNSREENNATAVKYLLLFMRYLLDDPSRRRITLSDTFKLEFRVKENDNDTGWVEKISNVGSDGTDILVKAMVNIMLINVFKEKASRKFGDFKLHCMMDEIGKLHPNNVKGILDFANCRNILLVNSSPTTYNVEDYRYTYLLKKDSRSNTQVIPLLTNKHSHTL